MPAESAGKQAFMTLTPDLVALLPAVVDLAQRAGVDLLRRRSEAHATVETKANENDFVSVADRASEELIVNGLLAIRPDDGILGEEGTEREGTTGYRWVIDPLDGTRNYLDGFGPWAVSIALQHNGETVLGVIRDPKGAETFAAVKGRGATRNGAVITCRPDRNLAQSLVAFSLLPSTKGKAQADAWLHALLPHVGDFRRYGSAVTQLAQVAGRGLDAAISLSVCEWDIAAGALIAAEAGAWVGSLDGGPPTAEYTIAVIPSAAAELRAVMATALGSAGAS